MVKGFSVLELKIRITEFNFAKIKAARANRQITRKMQILLNGLESDYRRIQWEVKDSAIRSQLLPNSVAANVQSVLKEAGLNCSIIQAAEKGRSTIIISTAEDEIDVKKLIAEHQRKALEEMKVPEDAMIIKELANTINTTWREQSRPAEDVFNILRDAPLILIELAEKIDDLFMGFKSSTTKKSTAETTTLSSVYYTNLFINMFCKASPDLFRLIFKKIPIGPVFIAGYQIINDAFYARKWKEGREQHEVALLTSAEKAKVITAMCEAVIQFLDFQIQNKENELTSLITLNTSELKNLEEMRRQQKLEALPNDKRDKAIALVDEIRELQKYREQALESTKNLSVNLRQKASRINVAQQVMMATKHIDRIFNIAFIGLGIATFFFPPLAIPATIIAIGKGLTRKKLEDRIRTGTEIVQGIYDTDDSVVLTAGNNKAAIKKSKTIKKMVLHYAPVAVVSIKLGIRRKATYARTKKVIRKNPQYILYLPDSFSYQPLGLEATPRQIRGQVDSYSMTCRELIFHLGMIEGRDLNGKLPTPPSPLHPPHITNINEIRDMINDWAENLIQQIRDQQINPQSSRNSYFTDKQIETIKAMRDDAMIKIDAYQFRLEELDTKTDEPVRVSQFDHDYAIAMRESIYQEIFALREIAKNKTNEQSIANIDQIKERLNNRIDALANYCMKCPDRIKRNNYGIAMKSLKHDAMNVINDMQVKKVKKAPKKMNPTKKNLGYEVSEDSKKNQVFVPVHHHRFFESRSAMVNKYKEHIAKKRAQSESTLPAELVLLPVSKVSSKALFEYKNSYWKMIWLVRGINRAVESIDLTLKNKGKIGAEMNPKNLEKLLNFYKEQLEKINAHSKNFTFSAYGQNVVKKRVEQTINRIENLIRENQQQHPQPPNPS